MISKLYIILFSIILFTTISCSKQYIPIHPQCGEDPVMKEVNVVNGTVSGKDLDNVIDNTISLWIRIEELKIKGRCK